MFWGLILEAGMCYSQKVVKSFHVSMATLEIRRNTSSGNIPVILEYGDGFEYLLCNLNKTKSMQCRLDLDFKPGESIGFYTACGNSRVHLTGYFLENLEENECEDEGSSDEEVEEEEEEEEEEAPAWKSKKRKTRNACPTAGKKQKSKDEDEEDEEEPDEDKDEDEDDEEKKKKCEKKASPCNSKKKEETDGQAGGKKPKSSESKERCDKDDKKREKEEKKKDIDSCMRRRNIYKVNYCTHHAKRRTKRKY